MLQVSILVTLDAQLKSRNLQEISLAGRSHCLVNLLYSILFILLFIRGRGWGGERRTRRRRYENGDGVKEENEGEEGRKRSRNEKEKEKKSRPTRLVSVC